MGRAESPITSYVTQRLQMLEFQGKAYFARSNSFSGFLTRYNGSQGHVSNGKRGLPDITACIGGKYVGIELKAPSGRQSSEQLQAQDSIERAGGVYVLIRTPEEFEEFLEKLTHHSPTV